MNNAKLTTLDFDKLNPKWKTCAIPLNKEGQPASKNIVAPLCKLSYPHFLVPQENRLDPSKKPMYGVNILIPPEFDISMLKAKAKECAVARWGAKLDEKDANGRPVMKMKSPFLKAEEYKSTTPYVGWTLLRVQSPTKPGVVMFNRNKEKIRVEEGQSEEIYGGRWALITLNPFAYPKAGKQGPNTGVSFGLNHIFLMHNDTPLGSGRARAEDEFADVDSFEDIDVGDGSEISSVDELF